LKKCNEHNAPVFEVIFVYFFGKNLVKVATKIALKNGSYKKLLNKTYVKSSMYDFF